MQKRILAALLSVALGTGVIVSSNDGDAHAEPTGAPTGVTGSGPCSTDPKPVHVGPIPKTLEMPIQYPVISPVPYPAPTTAPVRIQTDLPADPCTDPCPDLTDEGPAPQSLAGLLGLPELILKPQPFVFGIPVPGQQPDPLPSPPAQVTPAVDPAPRSPARATPRVREVVEISKQTGAHSINRTDKRWQVYGTDLGIMWESKPGEIATAFGDTVGRGFHPPGGMGGDWRSNVLAFSTDRELSDGVSYDSMVTDSRCHAAELLSSRKIDNVEITTIPTSGFAIGDRQYMSYMSMRTWSSLPGTFFTNHGGIAYSDDHGQTWTKDPFAKWDNIFGLSKFQVSAMVPQGDYVYMFGTPPTRLGDVGLARVPKDQVLNTSAYQYWSNDSWTPVGGFEAASPVVTGPVGELSVRYDSSRNVWQMSYLDTSRLGIVLRESDSPQGLWSEPAQLVSVTQYPQLYGGFIHPWSTGEDLYLNISTWNDYNVYMMGAKIG
ncbi:DUF4185 domain-containing protein [Antrihabitans sp. YC3-6]|uniref:DUF4185 domain-containing protein n=1 Tax=Antrihabitans stalagmiti TaxID=2799499 RepID=A0A934U263_9NOCA|nr:DUF4185 domain-containing protein [Antrihabitans stalagmiti]MBJ8338984.1 DUF4185 domain-containing protein [Antrihabitans stalagmiti]